MGYVSIPGGMAWPQYPYGMDLEQGFGSMLIDATGEKVAFLGRVFIHGGGSVDISRVGFRFGTVTKAGGSALTVSLQDVATATGPAAVPDETQDQTVAVANADAAFASDTWYRTGTLSANRTVAHGDLLAVVIEYDGAGRLGADAVNISTIPSGSTRFRPHNEKVVLKTGGTWATQTHFPVIVLEDTDGNFYTFFTGLPLSTWPTFGFDDSPADEYGMQFTVPTPMKVDGAWTFVRCETNAADFVWSLYDNDGTTVLATNTLDANQTDDTATKRFVAIAFSEVTLLPGNTYRMAIKLNATATVRMMKVTVADAGHLATWPGGTAWQLAHRVGTGSWDAGVTTERLMMGLYLSKIWGYSPAQLVNNAGLVG